jgi:Icc protein
MLPTDSTDPARTFRLLHLTDPHLFADPAGEVHSVNTSDALQRVVAQALAEVAGAPDAILVTGDIADDLSAAAYERLVAILQPAAVPVFCVPGNHDDPATMARVLGGAGFQCTGRAQVGGWGLSLLDSQVPGEPYGMISPAAFARLDADLHVLRDLHVLLAVHHPPLPVGSRWIDGMGLRNATELFARLERFPNVRAVLSGHVHQAFDAQRGAVRILATPSTCVQFTPRTRDFALDARPPGYRWLRLAPGGRWDTSVQWLR